MELKARQKRGHQQQQSEKGGNVDADQNLNLTTEAIAVHPHNETQMPNEPFGYRTPPEKAAKPLEHSIQIQCNTLLYTTLQNMVTTAHAAGDFRYTSVTDVIREAIRSHQQGMQITELAEKGRKRSTSIRIDQELFNHYKSWPVRLRTQILERVIRSYLKTL